MSLLTSISAKQLQHMKAVSQSVSDLLTDEPAGLVRITGWQFLELCLYFNLFDAATFLIYSIVKMERTMVHEDMQITLYQIASKE